MYTSYIPAFLYLCAFMWGLLLIVVVCFAAYMRRIPERRIERFKVQAIENKKRLGIRIYRL